MALNMLQQVAGRVRAMAAAIALLLTAALSQSVLAQPEGLPRRRSAC